MNSLFPPELRTASVVERWSIVRTLTTDTVANHSFYVTFYALQVARLVEWEGPYADLTFAALMHDVEETFTSDIISPVKSRVVDPGALSNFVSAQMKERLPLVEAQLEAIYESRWGGDIEKLVKVADKVDAVIYLVLEQRMGNIVLAQLYQDACNNLHAAWKDLCVHGGFVFRKYEDEIWPAIQAHWKNGSMGITG